MATKQQAVLTVDAPVEDDGVVLVNDDGFSLNQSLFEGLMAELNKKGGSGNYAYLQDGKNYYRLYHDPRDGKQIYGEVQRWWNGQARKKYLLRVVVFGKPNSEDEPVAKFLVVPKTVLQTIVGIAAEGYDLFDKQKGFGLSITKSGQGLDVTYTVLASRQPRAIPEGVELLEETWDEAISAFNTADFERDKNRLNKGDEEGGGGKKKGKVTSESLDGSW